MDAKQFLAEFGHIANAPGGVAHLKELVLDFAITGKLTNQDVRDTDANLSLSGLALRREQILEEERLSASRKHKDLTEPSGWFQLPMGWAWEFLGYLSAWPLKDGDWIESKDQDPSGDIRIIQLADVGVGEYKNRSNRFLTVEKAQHLGCYFLNENDVLIARLPDPLGRACIFPREDKPCVTVVDIAVCRCDTRFVNPFYLVHCINSPSVLKTIASFATGTTRQRVATGILGTIVLPIPPIEEQSRIVTKVDELMALCDKLETQQQQRSNLQNNLRQSTLQAVAASTSPNELQTAWTRLTDNFGQLFHEPEDVAGFKGLILDLAVSGQLLKIEHRTSSTGLELLDAIAAKRVAWSRESVGQEQKEALAMLKKLRTQQVARPDALLPAHWTWASLLQVSQAVVDCHNKTAPYVNDGIHLIRTTDIRNGRMELANTRKISEETYAYWARRMPPQRGDIFFTREAPMGEAAIVPDGQQVCLGQRSMLIRLFPELFSNRFLLYVIQSPSFQARMIEAAIGMTVKHLRVGGVEDLVVPVPPKAEQERIVAIVDKLFSLCDHYAIQLSRKQKKAAHLAESAVASITGITTESNEDEPLKAPQTELIASLRLGTPPSIKEQAPLSAILAHQNGDMPANDLWQRFGGDIDAFHAQLKLEVGKGWIEEPTDAGMRETEAG